MQLINSIQKELNKNQLKISSQILKEIKKRTKFILDVGLGYLTLNRSSKLYQRRTQRIRQLLKLDLELQMYYTF